ncbi:MAG TPA: NAD(P)-dependent alcohol dehydrogenase [Chloroflexia bacterium]|nr:NAD(P)-dependent alcohol dehydrogenase [Chloroflexia bacterium]
MLWTAYGPPEVLQLREVERPVPRDNEVLIRIHATTVTAGDMQLRGLKVPALLRLPARLFLGLMRPSRVVILGQELAGQIEAVGQDVKRFSVGDKVFAATGLRLGTYAEYKCLPETGVIALKPAHLSYQEAAAVAMGGLEALQHIRKANLQSGQKVLIIGAGGSIGTFAVQLAKHSGAEVTALDRTEKLEMLRSIGADHVIDYTREDFTRSGETYDVIIDVAGKSPFSRSKRALKQNGTYFSDSSTRASQGGGKKRIHTHAAQRAENLALLKALLESGEIKTVIDRTYPLEQLAEAHRYVETGLKKGHVIITVE